VRSGERRATGASAQDADLAEGGGQLRKGAAPLTFGPFRLDPGQRQLVRIIDGDEKPVALGSRALDLLMLLACRPGELISKDELMDAGWPDVAVEENNLSVQISSLRRALGTGRTGCG
jgi:DNA-binding winged helix-turn-helix (wHTH) protein